MSLPIVTQETIDTIFDELSKMEVELDENPIIYGPKRLNGKIAEARKFQTKCEGLFLKVSKWLQKYKAGVRAAQLSLDLSKKHLFTNDPEVRAGRNLADRDAIASMKLKDEVEAVSVASSTMEDLESILVVIKSRKGDLRDVQSRIKDQIRLCQEEISLGSRWGNKKFGEVEKEEKPDPNKTTLKQLRENFQEEKEEPLINGTFEAGMEDFLDAVDNVVVDSTAKTSLQNPPNKNLDSVLDDILGDSF